MAMLLVGDESKVSFECWLKMKIFNVHDHVRVHAHDRVRVHVHDVPDIHAKKDN